MNLLIFKEEKVFHKDVNLLVFDDQTQSLRAGLALDTTQTDRSEGFKGFGRFPSL